MPDGASGQIISARTDLLCYLHRETDSHGLTDISDQPGGRRDQSDGGRCVRAKLPDHGRVDILHDNR